uniref:Uncharacterized protein n=1 Tax=Anguilla anguilla TaxID=7936 RepID=A0A0E9REJ1_ANGAN
MPPKLYPIIKQCLQNQIIKPVRLIKAQKVKLKVLR